MNSIADWILAE